MFAPSLQRFDHVSLNARILQEYPCLVDEECLESGADLPICDDRVGPMQDVEELWLQQFGILAHPLKVEALEPGEGDRVFGIVEEKSELPASRPLCQALGHAVTENV